MTEFKYMKNPVFPNEVKKEMAYQLLRIADYLQKLVELKKGGK